MNFFGQRFQEENKELIEMIFLHKKCDYERQIYDEFDMKSFIYCILINF